MPAALPALLQQAMLACWLVLAVCGAHKGITMASTSNSNSNSNRKLVTTGKAPATTTATTATSPVALAPHTHAAPTTPSTQPAANWQLVGQPSTAKQAVNGVGPAPKQGTVGYAALATIAAAGAQGATLAAMQAAITAVGCKGKHPVMPLLTWLAKNRGYTFLCQGGLVTCPNAK